MYRRRGFTLIELLVVIAIIGILASVVLASVGDARAKSRDARRLVEIRHLSRAFAMYALSEGNYPATSIACLGVADGGTCWGDLLVPGNTALMTAMTPYAPTMPTDPSPSRGWGDRYVYTNSTVYLNCNGATPSTGPFILYRPDAALPAPGICAIGTFACCPSAGYLCASLGGYFCAVPLTI